MFLKIFLCIIGIFAVVEVVIANEIAGSIFATTVTEFADDFYDVSKTASFLLL